MTMKADNERDGVDIISSLHDTILHHILSFIPTKFAIRTSVLSKRWKRVWQETPSISIKYNRMDHIDSINETLSRYLALKITSFDVSTSLGICITTMHVDRLINLAMSRNAENLSLKLKYEYSFPDFFFINSSVKQLSLTLRSRDFIVPKCNVSWTSLRNLSLNFCIMSDESIANILTGCPLLESLILNSRVEIPHLDLSRSINLTRLEIIGNSSKIVAPHIHYLSLTNFHKPPNLVDVSSLTEANFNPNYTETTIMVTDGFFRDMLLNVLTKLQNIEKLTIGAVVLKILSLPELRDVLFPQLKIKALTVESVRVQSIVPVIPGIIRLLQNSPGLKKITVHTIERIAIRAKCLEKYLNAQRFANDRCWSGFFPVTKETSTSFNSMVQDDKSEHVALFMELVFWNLRLGGYLNAIEYQTLISKVPKIYRNKNFKVIP